MMNEGLTYFRALDPIDYDKADFRYIGIDGKRFRTKTLSSHLSLLKIASATIIAQYEEYISHAIRVIPTALLPALLREALVSSNEISIKTIINQWPMKKLIFADILAPDKLDLFAVGDYSYAFNIHLKSDLMVYYALCQCGPECQLTEIDFRGLNLNEMFTKKLIQRLQFHSMTDNQRKNIRRLEQIIKKNSGIGSEAALMRRVRNVLKLIADGYQEEKQQHNQYKMQIHEGRKIKVFIDEIILNGETNLDLEYFISQTLQDEAPLTVYATNIIICAPFIVPGEPTLMSPLPFTVFKATNSKECLKGVSISDVHETLILEHAPDLMGFTQLSGLSLSMCCIHLREGITRQRSQTKEPLYRLLAALPNLLRLDISYNCITGCLEELLSCLQKPLIYLNVNNCDLRESDLQALAGSKHAKSLREIGLGGVCGLFPNDDMAANPGALISILPSLTSITVISIAKNQLRYEHAMELVKIIPNCWKRLKSLRFHANLDLSDQSIEAVFEACCRIPCFQNIVLRNQTGTAVRDYKLHLLSLQRQWKRTDVKVELR